VDEEAAFLGEDLQLPQQFEKQRERLLDVLPPINYPTEKFR
jgi:glyoxalase family protein